MSVCAVVSIRGTLSLEDCVTDFMCEPVSLDDWIKEVESANQPNSFSQRVPPVKPASKPYIPSCIHSCYRVVWASHDHLINSPKKLNSDIQAHCSGYLLGPTEQSPDS